MIRKNSRNTTNSDLDFLSTGGGMTYAELKKATSVQLAADLQKRQEHKDSLVQGDFWYQGVRDGHVDSKIS